MNIPREILVSWAREIYIERSAAPRLEYPNDRALLSLSTYAVMAAMSFSKEVAALSEELQLESPSSLWDSVFHAWQHYKIGAVKGSWTADTVPASLEAWAKACLQRATVFENAITKILPLETVEEPPVTELPPPPLAKCSACEKPAIENGLCEDHASEFRAES